ncbi:MAG: 50S ribosomal protein L3 [Deltaproteobacteria bacterium]|nr:50S ribosomal protein L3 [Deltaproteobacteria bacterium]
MPNTMGLLGKKIGMTRVYSEEGQAIPVTVIEAGPCVVLQKKTEAKEGYNAIQVGFGPKKESRLNKPEAGHFKAAAKGGFYHIKEFRVSDPETYELGQEIQLAELVKIGDEVHVSGRSKGRGFQGVIKRHGFKGGRKTHGSMFHRRPGSIGCSAWPSRVIKGKKMPGRMGNELSTKKNLTVVDVRPDENIMLVKGSVPGARQGLLQIYVK